jgi:hypothetical protein
LITIPSRLSWSSNDPNTPVCRDLPRKNAEILG